MTTTTTPNHSGPSKASAPSHRASPAGPTRAPGTVRPLLDLRQVLDTLAMRILLAVSGVCVLGMALLATVLQPLILEPDIQVSSGGALIAVSLVLSVVLPVLTVLTVAGEWPQSIQQTFLLRPRRTGVLVSKVIAALAITILVMAVTFGLALGLSALVGSVSGRGASFQNLGDNILGLGLAGLFSALFAIACATLLQGTALAMVVSIVVPFVVTIAGNLIGALGSQTVSDVLRYVDLSTAAQAIATNQIEVSSIMAPVLLIVLPFIAGAIRWSRREIG
ncbi:ABC transporter permease [Brachybacterium endophyticum]|uniref:ABC transporter permease n=1 Tax=Brachybacterium endophyticum TaxID=2182385 RepID=A0A2U2RLA0_9MICO|nr:ABC transporter permease [Brachybacterium endophyticum]PWH06611.1 ABC transporter permease [Brachybacterium endophyticum]